MNLFVEAPDYARLTSMHFYAWKRGLKTGMYYLRTRPAADAIPFTVDPMAAAGARNRGERGDGDNTPPGSAALRAALPKARGVVGDACLSCQG